MSEMAKAAIQQINERFRARQKGKLQVDVIDSLGMACLLPVNRWVARSAAVPLSFKVVNTRLEATQAMLDVTNDKYTQAYDRWRAAQTSRCAHTR